MQEQRWQKIEQIFAEAVRLPIGDRQSFVERTCAGDGDLCGEILELLREDEENREFLSEPVFAAALKLLNDDFSSLIGKTFHSRYRIVKFIGRGGMGAVFLAEDLRLKRPLALKIIDVSIFGRTENIRRFEREAISASKISHPNVAHVYEFGEDENLFFLAMEYVDGKTLRQLIKENDISPDRAVKIVRQIAEALAAAHEAGIIHRDIKPENVIVAERDLVKVLDFGLAKASDRDRPADENVSLLDASLLETTPGQLFGTTAYMSPEQVREQPLDERTDLWSLGVIFYEMLAGGRPFDGATRNDTIAAILKSEPEKLSKKGVSPEIEKIVFRLLEKDRDRRFQTARDLLLELERSNEKAAAKSDGSARYKRFVGFLKHHNVLTSVIILAFLLITSGTLYKYTSNRSGNTNADNNQIRSIAVLPFINESGDSDKEYLADGLTDMFIYRLSQLPDLTVKARSSVFHYKNKNFEIQEVGNALSVQALLIGRVSQKGKELRLSLELVDSKTGNQIWGEQYNYHEDALMEFRREIVQDVANKLRSRLSNTDEQRMSRIPTDNSEAYQLFLRGRYHWSKRTAKDLEKSVEYYERAVAIDPNFAFAHAGLADTYVLLSGFGVSSPQESFPKAKKAAERAIQLDDTLAPAYASLAYILFNYDWNFEESERLMRRAIELDPNYSTAYHWYGNANLLAMGKLEESIASVERAYDLDPLSLIINADLATAYLYAGRYEEAVAQYKKTLELDENFYYAYAYLGRTYMMMGEHEKAIEAFEKADQLSDDPRIYMLFACNYSRMGKRAEALKKIEELKKISREKYVSPYYFALAYAALGENDMAFQWLEKAYEAREGRMTLIKADPLLNDLRSDPRFTDLLKRIGLEK
jgi:Kae1-associated kinase Bud32